MAQHLAGIRVALTGPRKSKEMALLVEKMGGIPLVRPAQGTVFLDDRNIRDGLVSLISDPPDWAVLTTGMGLDAIFEMAEDMDIAGQLLDVLSEASIAARGYKTVNSLRKRKLAPLVRDDDGSTDGLIREFAPHNLAGKSHAPASWRNCSEAGQLAGRTGCRGKTSSALSPCTTGRGRTGTAFE